MRQAAGVGVGATPSGEHRALGVKDSLSMAFAECAATVDKGIGILVSGAHPVHPSGGPKAMRHPRSATGVAPGAELSGQLRRTVINQVDCRRIALAHNIDGPSTVSAVTILEGTGDGG